MTTAEYWYRYDDRRVSSGVDEFDNSLGPPQLYVYLSEYRVEKTTPKGVWVWYAGSKKFILRDARKRFACPTKAEAMESFLARKRKHARILASQLSSIETVINAIEQIGDKGVSLNHPIYAGYAWQQHL